MLINIIQYRENFINNDEMINLSEKLKEMKNKTEITKDLQIYTDLKYFIIPKTEKILEILKQKVKNTNIVKIIYNTRIYTRNSK